MFNCIHCTPLAYNVNLLVAEDVYLYSIACLMFKVYENIFLNNICTLCDLLIRKITQLNIITSVFMFLHILVQSIIIFHIISRFYSLEIFICEILQLLVQLVKLSIAL